MLPLTPHAQRRAAGHEDIGAGAALEQVGHDGCSLEHLLEVVEDEQDPVGGEVLLDRLQ